MLLKVTSFNFVEHPFKAWQSRTLKRMTEKLEQKVLGFHPHALAAVASCQLPPLMTKRNRKMNRCHETTALCRGFQEIRSGAEEMRKKCIKENSFRQDPIEVGLLCWMDKHKGGGEGGDWRAAI